MPKNARSDSPESVPEIGFEEAVKKLEGIVEAMEGDDLPLEKLLSRYEEGIKLARVCQTKLSEAEVKIQQLERTSGGDLVLKPASLSDQPSAE